MYISRRLTTFYNIFKNVLDYFRQLLHIILVRIAFINLNSIIIVKQLQALISNTSSTAGSNVINVSHNVVKAAFSNSTTAPENIC